jgi:hypothetical protein
MLAPTGTDCDNGCPVIVGGTGVGVLAGLTTSEAPALVTELEPLLTTTEIVPASESWTLFIVKLVLLKMPTGAPFLNHS